MVELPRQKEVAQAETEWFAAEVVSSAGASWRGGKPEGHSHDLDRTIEVTCRDAPSPNITHALTPSLFTHRASDQQNVC